jgi:hypothetical protein
MHSMLRMFDYTATQNDLVRHVPQKIISNGHADMITMDVSSNTSTAMYGIHRLGNHGRVALTWNP